MGISYKQYLSTSINEYKAEIKYYHKVISNVKKDGTPNENIEYIKKLDDLIHYKECLVYSKEQILKEL